MSAHVEQNVVGGCGCCGAPDEVGFGSVERRHEVFELTAELAAEGHLRRSSIRISCGDGDRPATM